MDRGDSYLCPGCDREVRVGIASCPHCHPRRKSRKPDVKRGRKPWESGSGEDGLDLPGASDFDYDDFVAREFGHGRGGRSRIRWYWWLTALLLLLMIGIGALLGLF